MKLDEIKILFNLFSEEKQKIKEDIIFWNKRDGLEAVRLSIIFDYCNDFQKKILKKCFFYIKNLEDLKFIQNFSKELGLNVTPEDIFNSDNSYYIFDDVCGSTSKRFIAERIYVNFKKNKFGYFFIE